MKSIILNKKQCYFCESQRGLHNHHIFKGNPRRKLSEKYGLKVYLCQSCHQDTDGIHGKNGSNKDLELKRIAQLEFEKIHSRELFMEKFIQNYLD